MFYYSSGRSGGGDVGAGAQGVVLGVLQGTKVGGKEALETISATSSSVVKGTVGHCRRCHERSEGCGPRRYRWSKGDQFAGGATGTQRPDWHNLGRESCLEGAFQEIRTAVLRAVPVDNFLQAAEILSAYACLREGIL